MPGSQKIFELLPPAGHAGAERAEQVDSRVKHLPASLVYIKHDDRILWSDHCFFAVKKSGRVKKNATKLH